jgi:type II secretory pathway pseudopilin PulG
MTPTGRKPTGYALLEVVIILLVLAVVASTVGPRVVVASYTWRNSRLKSHVEGLRKQIDRYRADHNGQGPHLNERGQIDGRGLIARMGGVTYPNGKLSKFGSCGPYVQEWPANPFSEESVARTVKLGLSERPPRDDTTGWYYNIYTCLLSPNSAEGAHSLDPTLPAQEDLACQNLSSPQIMLLGLRLTAIMEGPEGKVAVINGQPMRVGQSVMGAAIIKIGRYHVELEGDGRHITIGMIPENRIAPNRGLVGSLIRRSSTAE